MEPALVKKIVGNYFSFWNSAKNKANPNGTNPFRRADKLAEKSWSAYQRFGLMYIKFANDSVVLLKYSSSNPAVEIPTMPGKSHSYVISFCKIRQSVLKIFTEQNIKGIKMAFQCQPKEPIAEREINDNESHLVKEYANCFVSIGQINLNTPDKEMGNKNSEIENKEAKSIGIPKPTNDTIGVSIYKQWKIKVMIGKDGIPINNESDHFIQFNKDGTYTSIYFNDNTKYEDKGKFELMNDNKIIIFYPEKGKSNSAAIIKLTNKEFNIKGEMEVYHSVY